MKIFRNTTSSILIFIIGVILISFIFNTLETDKKLINYITYFGSYISIFGLLITIGQILSVKEISKETAKKVEESIQRTFRVLSISKLSKSIQMIQEIQGYIRHEKLESALLRLKDLKIILIQIRQNQKVEEFVDLDKYNLHVTNISIDSTNINKHISGTKVGINRNKIVSNLEDIENFLVEIEGHLKYKENE